MGRPRAYDRDAALIAARDLFWEQGYERTSIADLEQRTGLNRSSIYQEFGSKRELFETVLGCYADQEIARQLAGLRDESLGGLDAAAAPFLGLAALFRDDALMSKRGCLMVNTIAEMAAADTRLHAAAAAYRDRLCADFGNALARAARAGETDPAHVDARTRLLAGSFMGVLLTVRIDPADAAALCETIAAQVETWRT